MAKANSGYIYLIVIAVLAVLLACLYKDNTTEKFIERHTTDTLFVYRIDTIVEYRPRYIDKHTIDTLYIATDSTDTLRLPIEQKYYHKDSVYDLWISGVEPLAMDSFRYYPKTEYRYIDNTIIKEIYPQRTEIYFFGGLNSICGTLSPEIGISIKTKKEWLISPKIGLCDNKAIYGLTIGKKIN